MTEQPDAHDSQAQSPTEGSRQTEQIRAIRDVVEVADRPLRVAEILETARERVPTLGQATVYRGVKRGVEEGWLHPVEMPGSGTLYEPAGKDHHHHFECTHCHRVFEIHGCPGRGALEKLAPRGFDVRGHDLTLFGLCAECNR